MSSPRLPQEAHACLQHEGYILSLHKAIADLETHRRQLSAAHAKADDFLREAEEAIVRQAQKMHSQQWPAGLEMPDPDLCHSEPPVELVAGLRALKEKLQDLSRGGTVAGGVSGADWPQVFRSLVEAAIGRAAQATKGAEYQGSPPRHNTLTSLPEPVLQRLEALSGIGADVVGAAEAAQAVRAQLADLCRAQSLPMDGPTAGQVGWAKVQLQTRLISFLKDMVRAIEMAEVENARLGNMAELRQQAEAQGAMLKDPKWRLKKQCERALQSMNDALAATNAANEDAARKHSAEIARSRAALRDNLDRQGEIWRQIDALHAELQQLGAARHQEMQWQLAEMARETSRREEHKWAHQVANEHKRRLETTLRHCDEALRCVDIAEQLAVEGCEAGKLFQHSTAQDLAARKIAVLAEQDKELARLQLWGGEHRTFVQAVLKAAQTGQDIPLMWNSQVHPGLFPEG